AHGGEDGASGFKGFSGAADHEKEFTFFGAPGAAGDRCVKEAYACGAGCIGNFACEGGGDGAGVEVDYAFLESGEGTARFFVRPPQNLFEGGRVAYDRNENVGC